MGLVAAARDRLEADAALLGSELSASTSPHALAVLAGLTAMRGDIEQAAGALAVAATRARRYASGCERAAAGRNALRTRPSGGKLLAAQRETRMVNRMALRWYAVVIDCRDVKKQARWWAEALDWKLDYESDEECGVAPPWADEDAGDAPWDRTGPGLFFVPVPEGKTIKNRLHIDLAPHTSQDRAAEIARLEKLGAKRVDVGQAADVTWTVMADPEGNEFCVLSSRDD